MTPFSPTFRPRARILMNAPNMFTGIIRHLGVVKSVDTIGDGLKLTIHSPQLFSSTKIGDSIAINGVCLTALASTKDTTTFELGAETLRKTTFAFTKLDALVNIEFPMRIGDTFDGHFVQGHVDGTATITELRPDGETTWLTVEMPADLARLAVHKGSIAIDGVSLTVAEKVGTTISIMLLPYTVKHTAFQNNTVGDAVNIETDMLARHVAELMRGLT